MERLHVVISGRVQGVGFRAFVVGRARHFELVGWVRNLPDGRVEALAEGPREALESFLAYCHKGPLFSKVTGVEEIWTTATGDLDGFELRR